MTTHLAYLYLVAPLHTGGSSQEGNLVGIARESHTDLPYIPSSTIRGRLRANTPQEERSHLWGNTIEDVMDGKSENLTQGSLWVGDASILWFPVPSLSHGIIWISSPALLKRWARLSHKPDPMLEIPPVGSFSKYSDRPAYPVYLRDAIFQKGDLKPWDTSAAFIPEGSQAVGIMDQFLVLSELACTVLIDASLWRQVKISLDKNKSVDGGFRSEESIPPETLLYFPFGNTIAHASQHNGQDPSAKITEILGSEDFLQLGGLESLGRGFTHLWVSSPQ